MPPRPSRAKKKPVVDDLVPVEDPALGPDIEVPVEEDPSPPVEPLAAEDPGPLTAAEVEILHEAVEVGVETDEPPIDPADWPEDPEVADIAVSLRSLRSDVRPVVGAHYVIFGGKPVPVTRAFAQTEDEFVRSQLNVSDELRDHDGQRVIRADRTLRMRYRGYVCGEMSSL